MKSNLSRLFLAVVLVAVTSTFASAQGSFFSSLSGTVVDSQGGVIPGANVKIRNNGTGEEVNTVSGSDGGFSAASLPGGIYSVTVSLMGFKTSALNSVTLNAATPASVKVTLRSAPSRKTSRWSATARLSSRRSRPRSRRT